MFYNPWILVIVGVSIGIVTFLLTRLLKSYESKPVLDESLVNLEDSKKELSFQLQTEEERKGWFSKNKSMIKMLALIAIAALTFIGSNHVVKHFEEVAETERLAIEQTKEDSSRAALNNLRRGIAMARLMECLRTKTKDPLSAEYMKTQTFPENPHADEGLRDSVYYINNSTPLVDIPTNIGYIYNTDNGDLNYATPDQRTW